MKLKAVRKISRLLLLVLAIDGCSQSAGNQKNTGPAGGKAILEVQSYAPDTSYPRGNILDIRLYQNRRVEFDFYPPNTPDRLGMKFSVERLESMLSEAQFDKFVSLLNASDLGAAALDYPPSRTSSTDSFIRKTVTYRIGEAEKKVSLEERDSHLHLSEKSEVYPRSLISLLELVEEVNRQLRREIDPKSR